MKKAQVLLLTAVGLLATLVAVLAMRNRQPPVLPPDAIHQPGSVPAGCLTCHASGAATPRPKTHPVGNDCLRCHGLP